MSDEPAQSTQPRPSYDVYAAPAYGDVAPEASTQLTPPLAAPEPANPYAAPPPPEQPWGAYPGATPYQVPSQYLVNLNAPTHALATTSLVLGIIGLFSALLTPFVIVTILGVVCSPFAIWLGSRARREINANPQAWGGQAVATAGFVIGIIGLVLGLLMLLLVLAVVVLFASIIASIG